MKTFNEFVKLREARGVGEDLMELLDNFKDIIVGSKPVGKSLSLLVSAKSGVPGGKMFDLMKMLDENGWRHSQPMLDGSQRNYRIDIIA